MLLVTLKIYISTFSHTSYSICFQFLSVASFYIVFFILSYNDYSKYQSFMIGVFYNLMLSPINYILLILEATGFILVDLGVEYVNNQI